jgi:hypothetical protein
MQAEQAKKNSEANLRRRIDREEIHESRPAVLDLIQSNIGLMRSRQV